MPQVSKVDRLSKEDREWFEQQLIKQRFAGYERLVEMAAERGIEISVSSAHRFGKGFKDRLERIRVITEQARAVVAESPDDEGTVNEALMRIVQERLFGLMVDSELDPDSLPKMARAIADVARASVSQKKMVADIRRQAFEEAAKEASTSARAQGLSDDGVNVMRAAIMEKMA